MASSAGFHIDYIGLAADHPASFRGYLRKNLPQQTRMKEFFEIDGTIPDSRLVCRDYAEELHSSDPQLCLLGIGENGHLAFNHPAEADFNDPLVVKIVHLGYRMPAATSSRGMVQHLSGRTGTGYHAPIPTLLRVPKLIATVPGHRKARVIRPTLEEPISTDCPATILRTHRGTTLYLTWTPRLNWKDAFSSDVR